MRLILIIIVINIVGCSEKNGLIESIMTESHKFDNILDDPEKYRLQIIYTQIDRKTDNAPIFTTYKYRVNPDEYFYPASMVKMPIAACALEKINKLSVPGLTADSKMVVDSVFEWQRSGVYDSTSIKGNASVEECIRRIFLVSDNDAFNRLYEFVGQEETNTMLFDKGYKNSEILHRLSVPLSKDQNRQTAPIRFFSDDSLIYLQPAANSKYQQRKVTPRFVGNGYYQNGELRKQPMNFSDKNILALEDMHNMLLTILFPDQFDQQCRFNLNASDFNLLYRAMYQFPKESEIPGFDLYDDGYCKFLMYGGSGSADKNIRVFNKVGEAYGFLIDMAYIVDFNRKIEFVLGAVLYVNEDGILNDDKYDYETVGFPFFKELGWVFYNYELNRPRINIPDLSKFKLEP